MLKAAQLRKLGLDTLADGLVESQVALPAPAPKESLTRFVNPLHVPSQHEIKGDEAYIRDLIIGSIVGTAVGTAGAALHKSIPASLLIGGGVGGITGLLRSYDKRSDPPGLNPVYTVPAGARLGALSGAIAGAGLGHLTPYGILPGALVGALAGTVSGASTSSLW